MNAKQKSRLVYWSATLLLLVIVGYNIWSYGNGYCTVATLIGFSLPAKLLLVGIAVATGYLMTCKARNKQLLKFKSCQCGSELMGNWSFCPKCGHKR